MTNIDEFKELISLEIVRLLQEIYDLLDKTKKHLESIDVELTHLVEVINKDY